MSERPRILVIDDEKQIRKLLRISLATQSWEALEAATGEAGLALAATQSPHVIVLDLGLPDMDGHDVLEALRTWSTLPVLVLSVRSDEEQKVRLLDSGANDYVTKPFGIQEFLARVRALLRHSPGELVVQPRVHAGPLCIDLATRLVTLNTGEVSLTRKEYSVLELLARNPGRVVTQQQLLRDVWGASHLEDSHYLRIVVGKLRQKLHDEPNDPHLIRTEPGIGYRLMAQAC
ncbi:MULTISPECIES: response regulator transcription factor [Pseudomonas]|uniref:Transcriptional regulator n=1 Tax=Pseudomonas fulva TaxID=47880 RepID=A0A0D0L904_9PSED|nr:MULTISPECIES: response regulator transcription factor [Pseudomonas]KIQ06498.1 transcriptional regulator [Pseudomonas fulva]